eukprot:tig00020562_g11179.t1
MIRIRSATPACLLLCAIIAACACAAEIDLRGGSSSELESATEPAAGARDDFEDVPTQSATWLLPRTVSHLDIERYSGRWYEQASSVFVKAVIERGCACVTADYTERDDGKVDVLNRCTEGAGGREIVVKGTAEVPVRLSPNPFPAPYWVALLGPVRETDEGRKEYAWAVVTDPTRLSLWILSRPRAMDDETYAHVLARMRGASLPVALLRRTEQGGACSYASAPSAGGPAPVNFDGDAAGAWRGPGVLA